jgi:hypothetical protein
VVAAEKLPVVVVGDVTGRAAAMIGCHAENYDKPVAGSAHERGKRSDKACQAILQPARRAATNQVAHDEPKIEAARMN